MVTILGALGPYVWKGVRSEQVGVYGLLLLVGVVAAPTLRRHSLRGPTPWRLLGTWSAYVGVAAAASLGVLWSPAPWKQGDLLAGLDNVLSPFAVMLLVWLTVDPSRAQHLLLLAAKLIAVAMAGNGMLALVMTQVDLSGLLRPFWSASTGMTTAEYAAGLGRVSGVFNHPAEGGAVYGLAGVCAWYAWQHRPARMYLVLLPIVLGGLVTVSKIFVLGALPIILWLVWRSRDSSSRLGLVFVVGAGLSGIVASGLALNWTGLTYLRGILSPGNADALSFFTAGRVGEGSTLLSVIREVTRINPFFGVGAEGLAVPYDNGWVEAYVLAGLIGVLAYTFALVWMWHAGRRDPDPHRRVLMLAVAVLAAGGSMGLPVLTANRVATLFWLIAALAIAASWAARETTENDFPRPSQPADVTASLSARGDVTRRRPFGGRGRERASAVRPGRAPGARVRQ
ncbi:hypothetical protein [Blastococcus sp. SYSU DS0552]